MASPSKFPLTCWICGMAVSLEDCKSDEQGMAVHEDCYVRKTASKTNAAREGKLPPKPRRDRSSN
jgi:hypothetical protein